MRLTIPADQRPGTTLIEVLCAIFVMGVGLLAILTLFPLGMLNMAQAIRDDRCAQANTNASAMAHLMWAEQVTLQPIPGTNPSAQTRDPFTLAFENPNLLGLQANGQPIPVPVGSSPAPVLNPWTYPALPSYPVFLDGVGFNNPTNVGLAQQFWVGGTPLGIPRRCFSPTPYTPLTPAPPSIPVSSWPHFFQMNDDIAFGRDATPSDPTDPTGIRTAGSMPTGTYLLPTVVQKDGRYNWAFMLRRAKVTDLDKLEMAVVVYQNRSVAGPINEVAGTTQFVEDSTTLTMTFPTKPRIHKGTWLLDATMSYQVAPYPLTPDPHGYFYRVLAVTDEQQVGTNWVITVEVHTPVAAGRGTKLPNGTYYDGLVVVMESAVQVFEGKTLTRFSTPR